jgi:lipoprotein-anchoring transpeptidase ErfK/SrfK
MKNIGRTLAIATAGALAVIAVPPAATARSSGPASPYKPAPLTEMATLLASKTTYSRPGGRRTGSVSRKRPITTEETTLPVLHTAKRGTKTWYDVRLPGRPNSHTGWITSSQTSTWMNPWHIVVAVGPDTGGFSNQRRAYIYKRGKLVKDWLVVTGAPGRVTPLGQFFVEENVNYTSDPSFPGGPYALATSARSNTYTEFDGGPGQVAIHGMGGGLNATPGTAVSHGCIRLPNNKITWLAARIDPGTPVTIAR